MTATNVVDLRIIETMTDKELARFIAMMDKVKTPNIAQTIASAVAREEQIVRTAR